MRRCFRALRSAFIASAGRCSVEAFLKKNFVLLLLLLLHVRTLGNLIQQLLFVFLQRRQLHGAGELPPP